MNRLFIALVFLIFLLGCDIKPQVNGTDLFDNTSFSLALEQLIVDPGLEPIVERLADVESAINQLQMAGGELEQVQIEQQQAIAALLSKICNKRPRLCQ